MGRATSRDNLTSLRFVSSGRVGSSLVRVRVVEFGLYRTETFENIT